MFDKMKTMWRARHPEDPYDAEERKIHALLAELDAGTQEYTTAQTQLKAVNAEREAHRKSKGKFSGSDRASIWRKILGGGITIGGIVLLSKYEADGNMFTGEKKSMADGISKLLCRFFGGGD